MGRCAARNATKMRTEPMLVPSVIMSETNFSSAARNAKSNIMKRRVLVLLLLAVSSSVTVLVAADSSNSAGVVDVEALVDAETQPGVSDNNAGGQQNCVIHADGTETCPDATASLTCHDDPTVDCANIAFPEHCREHFDEMSASCPDTCGICHDMTVDDHTRQLRALFHAVPQVIFGEHINDMLHTVSNINTYMYNNVYRNASMRAIVHDCQNRHEHCVFWATLGECQSNPAYMNLQCAPACQTCHELSFDWRCPYNAAAPGAWHANDLNAMFERIWRDYQHYQPVVHSAPRPNLHPAQHLVGPWVLTMDHFLSDAECDRLIALGADVGYERSQDVGARNFDGTYGAAQSAGRTSTNAWCLDQCMNDTMTVSVHDKLQNLTQIPIENYEYLQLLRYEKDQFYEKHHDYIGHHVERAQGPRILTVFLYLNDVEAGGGTNFPQLNITVMPQRGRVLLWPSVLNSDPMAKDGRTEHQALPVEAGIKYGANAWVHMRDFKTPWSKGCH